MKRLQDEGITGLRDEGITGLWDERVRGLGGVMDFGLWILNFELKKTGRRTVPFSFAKFSINLLANQLIGLLANCLSVHPRYI